MISHTNTNNDEAKYRLDGVDGGLDVAHGIAVAVGPVVHGDDPAIRQLGRAGLAAGLGVRRSEQKIPTNHAD